MSTLLRADAVIFDKDGTLIDFDAFWVTLSQIALTDLVRELGQPETLVNPMLDALGVKNGKADINGILCKGTYQEMAEAIQQVLLQNKCPVRYEDMETLVLRVYNRNAHLGTVQPTCQNLRSLLETFRNQQKVIALVTTDNAEITNLCLKKLGIYDLFDCIYADDGTLLPKPNPDAALDLCRRMSLRPEHVVMVGDTMTDIRFARNSGMKAVAVSRDEDRRQFFLQHADAVLQDISELTQILK